MGKFEIIEFEKAPRVNEYIEDVNDLALAIEQNPKSSARIAFDIQDKGKNLLAIREAAKGIDKTVRVLVEDDSAVTKVGVKDNGKPIYEGQVIVTITLTDKYKDGRGRKPKGETVDEAPVEDAKAAKVK